MRHYRAEIHAVIARLVTDLNRVARIEDLSDIRPRPRSPAKEEDIRRYEDYLEMKLPGSYRSFLQMHNGFDWLAFSGDMLSIQEVMPGGAQFEPIRSWKRSSARYGLGEVMDGIVIASMGQPNNWVFLDPNQPGEEGELAVVKWDPAAPISFPDLVAFLESRIRVCQIALTSAQHGDGSDGGR